MFDFFLIFYTIIGGAVCGALTVFGIIAYFTSREPHPPAAKPRVGA